MPFKSDKQRKWMYANEPDMAKKWEKEEVIRGKSRNLIKQEIKSINEGFEKYHLGGLLDSKLKKRLERAIKLWSGKVDAVGDDYIKFRMSSPDVSRFPALLKKLDHNKNVWIGDKRKNNIWDRRQKINKLEATTSVSVPGYLTPNAFSKSTQKAIDDEDDDKNESVNEAIKPQGYSQLNRAARTLPSDIKDFLKALKKQDDDAVEREILYLKAEFDTFAHMLKDKKYTESVNEVTMAPFSSQEARAHINSDIKDMSKHLGKASQQVIKIMMDGVKNHKYTAMDIARGIKEGPARRTHFGEMTFINSLWTKMREKFRRYSKDGKLS